MITKKTHTKENPERKKTHRKEELKRKLGKYRLKEPERKT